MGDTNIRCPGRLRRSATLPRGSYLNKFISRLRGYPKITRRASLKDFFTLGSKAAACILCSEAHWRNVDRNNRATGSDIGKLNSAVQKKIRDSKSHPSETDVRI